MLINIMKKSGIFMVVALLLIANIMTLNVVASDEERPNKEVTVKQSHDEIKSELKKLGAELEDKSAERQEIEADIRGGFWAAPTPSEREKLINVQKEEDKLRKEIFDKKMALLDKITDSSEE